MKWLITIVGLLILFKAFKKFVPAATVVNTTSNGETIAGNLGGIIGSMGAPDTNDYISGPTVRPAFGVDKLSLGVMPDYIPDYASPAYLSNDFT